MQILMCVALVAIGGYLGAIVDTTTDMRVFGWLIAAAGVLGLLARPVLKRRNGA